MFLVCFPCNSGGCENCDSSQGIISQNCYFTQQILPCPFLFTLRTALFLDWFSNLIVTHHLEIKIPPATGFSVVGMLWEVMALIAEHVLNFGLFHFCEIALYFHTFTGAVSLGCHLIWESTIVSSFAVLGVSFQSIESIVIWKRLGALELYVNSWVEHILLKVKRSV